MNSTETAAGDRSMGDNDSGFSNDRERQGGVAAAADQAVRPFRPSAGQFFQSVEFSSGSDLISTRISGPMPTINSTEAAAGDQRKAHGHAWGG